MVDARLTVAERREVKLEDTWDLESLFADDSEWEEGLLKFEAGIPRVIEFKGSLGDSAGSMAAALNYIVIDMELLEERLGYYVMLRQSEDIGDTHVRGLYGRYINLATKFAAAKSWLEPEIQAVDAKKIRAYLNSELLADFQVYLQKLLRFKPHILSEKEESLLAKQLESVQVPARAFNALMNVDMDFGKVKVGDTEFPLTQSSLISLLQNKDRAVREDAYRKFYRCIDAHKYTMAELYSGTVLRNKYIAEIRSYPSARHMALFPDNVDLAVYDNLVSSVRRNLKALHEYYEMRAEMLNLKDNLRPWDVHASIVDIKDIHHTWDEAVEVICDALKPLGQEYVDVLRAGLLGRWADRYENKGKRSGAFSAGSYSGNPYILMNYKDEVLRDLFTMAHEAGHSMHSWYSARNNPFPHYDYTIFEAEVASTFNEQLLAKKLIEESSDDAVKAYLIGKQMEDVIATIYRQTMFAEFERDTHLMAERGEPLTVDTLRETYSDLLKEYFGNAMHFIDESSLEGLRIPHFYSAFYVYKYATGLSAAMTLSARYGGEAEGNAYLSFLKSGGSKHPIESLKLAGVDMNQTEPVDYALNCFANLVKEFRRLNK
ncbi:Oligoendopeptidase F [Olavius algarvensis spirochete endosymbiont]|uniref:oligoendopeptidase F n=1 Tax=Olavius algarvensis spirochete endosymbiont TaxID=260710 RepID=UPI000F17D83B|nr:oligoendopeptidase F [Olavius algarvensis spirochete endosymbiont]VDB00850.1 Oligoendopeptidase F [Olavius algarvensis spirochete endosymbiont]